MQQNWLVALALSLMIGIAQPARLLGQDNSAKEPETYGGERLCQPSRGAFPRATFQPEPEYDDKDRREKAQGTVVLSVIVTKEGRTAGLKVIKALTPGLDQQAIKAVSQWRFEPGTKDGQPCPVRLAIEVSFHLQ